MGVMDIVTWLVFGLIAGAIARLLMPGKDPGGVILTILLGIAGAMIGGLLGNAFGFGWNANPDGSAALDWRNLVLAVAGAFLLLLAYRAFRMLGAAAQPATAHFDTRRGYAAADMPSPPNLTETIKNSVTSDVVQKLSNVVGESPSATRKALDAMIPTILAGAASQAATSSGAARVFEMAEESASEGRDLASHLVSHA